MADELRQRSGIGWGISASILVHVALAFALFFRMPADVSEPEKEQTVSVEIVPPPEEEKAEEKPPEAPKQEEAKKEEPPPPPPPPPPPVPKQEETKTQEPPPQEAKQEQAKEEPPQGEAETVRPVPTLRSVAEFGDKDTGPEKSKDGNSSQRPAAQPVTEKPADLPVEKPEPTLQDPAVAEGPSGSPLPEDVTAPEVNLASTTPRQNGPAARTAPDATTMEIVAAPVATKPTTEAVKTPSPKATAELKEVKMLFSPLSIGDPVATIAIAGMSRDKRGGELCSTELKAQLINASYNVGMLPKAPLRSGTVLDVPSAGFSAGGQWYNLSFRCVVNEGVTKVLSFAFNVGSPVPQSEWRARRFPDP